MFHSGTKLLAAEIVIRVCRLQILVFVVAVAINILKLISENGIGQGVINHFA